MPGWFAGLMALTLTLQLAGAVCFSPPAGLIGWWPGDGNANNLLGTNHGILQGGALASAGGMVGNAFSFDGTNSYVQIPNSTVLQPTNLTVECWVRFAGLDSPGTAAALPRTGRLSERLEPRDGGEEQERRRRPRHRLRPALTLRNRSRAASR